MIFLLEVTWWAHRALWHLIFSGVLERHPDLQFVFTEQGTAWIPETLAPLDYFYGRMRASARLAGGRSGAATSVERRCAERRASTGPASATSAPASSGRPRCRCATRVGVDRIMWGSDYPHLEGELPVLARGAAAGVRRRRPEPRCRRWSAATRPRVYGFDLDALAPIAARVGPTVAEIVRTARRRPAGAERCPAFAPAPVAGAR